MNVKISLGAAIAFMAIVAAAAVSITAMVTLRMFNQRVVDLQLREERYSQIAQLDELVRDNYLGEIGQEALMSAIAEGFLAGLGDSYAEYLNREQYVRALDDSTSQVGQVGLVTSMDESGYMLVTEVYPDSPALAAEINVGDLLTKVGDIDVTTENYQEAVANLRGEQGTTLRLTVRRATDDREIELTRRYVPTPSLTSTLLDSNVGLITFSEFNESTGDQFTREVDSLLSGGVVALVLDVRGVNTVSSVDPVMDVLDKLLPEGSLGYMLDNSGVRTVLKTSDARSVTLPIAVLTNEGTTGEAELMAASLRDFGMASTVGTKTAGKGSVQTLLPLRDGSGAIRLTTAMYLSPSGFSFDKEGLKPDFEVSMTDDQKALAKADRQYDLQLTKALEIVLTASRGAASAQGQGSSSSGSENVSSETQASSSPSQEETDAPRQESAGSSLDDDEAGTSTTSDGQPSTEEESDVSQD